LEFLAELNLNARQDGKPLPVNFNLPLNGMSPLRMIVVARKWEMIAVGKCAWMMLDELGDNGQTALHLCARMGSLVGVRALCRAGANVNAEDTELWTPLHSPPGMRLGFAGLC
jgi:hypothetical protein